MDSLHSPVQPYQAHYQVNLPDKKNVDVLSAPHPSDIQHWLDALKPEGKINLVTESYLLLLFMLHLRFIYEKFPVKMFEIKLIALKVAESHLNALDQDRSQERLYSVAILGLSARSRTGQERKVLKRFFGGVKMTKTLCR
ncbi:hypothetical protein TNCT_117751 [Trichonephila clavata]|uniref:Uncharacterized protein n=1 Tax=Trichonephila clavata TaxID=2740835 RepID=A0A8X6G315_TRICU|nr:hypothetical protein TNCT_117751 [Trichonephila clavata]